ncbi:Pca regulon regulatory protein PcaR [Pseudonocardia sp. Ae168_Ps1]|uniref:IclR family transcriptional regulator domain-containing protein n=1 Tax=unclassified Pseudonocardia TaxID=2619320 RepID=UPI0006CB4EE9|nr:MULTISPECIES: IclR family transcriptional regulator C-terminal domain-containing protein [unclassified Pseudonocardia]ALE72935.1 IclR family transcriptional regulator [Pseudonocardia sp. EC080625-04]ALL76260.1 IclR family transcriptional regulator [Pseudonocardia sp. EC080610-09]ALL83287.1 IclR family transcriptional regulator [Pseudonocardia sp. EC080619-01]OLL72970.1 Pca regulon regulatory protein PcaR [Pseudonocardia sp. Ae150A_Ps1]OLL78946.1 Pca regulon regulatory protein PcaR [Pseudono
MSEEPGERREQVRSLARGLAVIRSFDADRPQQTLADVARSTGLTRAAARRFLLTLADEGYVRTDGRLFALTPRVLELGWSYLSAMGLPEVAAPHLERLVATVRESASVSVLDGDPATGYDVVYVARVPTSRIMTVAITIGTRFPAYATSMGRVLLAALPPATLDTYLAGLRPETLTEHTVAAPEALRAELGRVRADGHCVVDQELEEGLRSIAVPVHDRAGRVTAAANVSTHASRLDAATLRTDVLPELRACVSAIEADLRAAG